MSNEEKRLKTFNGSTTDGTIKIFWDLVDEQGRLFTNNFFGSVIHISLPGSGRSQTMKGP
jgi:hypothetical protein